MLKPILLTGYLVLASLSVLISAPAQAGQVCNETSFVIEAAKAWRTLAGLAVEGWARIVPGDCTRIGPVTNTEQYLYARSTRAYPGGVREWRGGLDVCVAEDDFAFENITDCDAPGLETRKFRQLGEAETERAILIEPTDFGARAREAGIQRLLQAAGYDINVIDGYAGRRTRRQTAAFERDARRAFGSDRVALIGALHDAALARNAKAGLKICNDAGAPIGAAVARLADEDWQTRGWWRITPGTCARTVSSRLNDNETFIFAWLVKGDILQPLAGGSEPFCIAPSRFTSNIRKNCLNSGFETAQFRATPAPEAGGIDIRLGPDDFEKPTP